MKTNQKVTFDIPVEETNYAYIDNLDIEQIPKKKHRFKVLS